MAIYEAGIGIIGWIIVFAIFYFIMDQFKGKKKDEKDGIGDDKN